MSATALERAAIVKARAMELGFQACAIATVQPPDPEDRLGQWLGAGFHADMAWMARSKEIRQDIRLRLPGAQSVIVVAKNYYQPAPVAQPPGSGKVARYAWGRDYHKVLKKPLGKLAASCDALEAGARSVPSLDSAPVLERSWAALAGLGWIGKNSLVLRRGLGSWFFLGTVATTVNLAADSPTSDHCGSCRACIEACPTDAIVADQVVDAGRCISYQTIENRQEIPSKVQETMEGWVFGCDICQEVCPWNRNAPETDDPAFLPRPGLPYPDLAELIHMDAATFDEHFAGTPVRRAKHAGMQRNARAIQRNTDTKRQ